jgi:hypothetical protein
MPLYYFQAKDSTLVEGKCELPDDATAVQFAQEIATQMTANNSSGAMVSVLDENEQTVCEIVVEAPTLH